MRRLLYVLLGAVLWSSGLRAQAPADTTVYAVSYVEVMPSSKAAVAALKQYRDLSRKDAGNLGLDLFKQIGRPGHFALVETWKDQQALDAHGTAAHTRQFQAALQPLRQSDYDQRPYKTLTVASVRPAAGSQAISVVTHVDTTPAPQSDGPGTLRRLAEASRKEDGNLRFDVLQHATRANHFTVVETWRSQQALDAHAAAAHTKQYREAFQPMSGSPLDERLYKAVE